MEEDILKQVQSQAHLCGLSKEPYKSRPVDNIY